MFSRRHQPQTSLSPRAVLFIVLAIVVMAGLFVLAFVDVAPPLRTREITIPPERFGK